MKTKQPKSSETDVSIKFSKNQDLWQNYVQTTTTHISSNMSKFRSFSEVYSYIASQRQLIAQKLEHGKDRGITNQFGRFRTEVNEIYETVKFNLEDGPWSKQAPYIRKKVMKSIDSTTLKPLNYRKVIADKAVTHEMDIPSHLLLKGDIKSSATLSHITMTQGPEPVLKLRYTPLKRPTALGDYMIANRYYDHLVNWNKHEGEQDFLLTAGRLAHHLAHIILVQRGNASIAEIIILSLAKYHKIKLGEINRSNHLSWDWKALLSSDVEKYSEWFAKHAFTNCSTLAHKGIKYSFDVKKPATNENMEFIEQSRRTIDTRHRGYFVPYK